MQRPPNYVTLYIWGPENGAHAGREAPASAAKNPNVIRIEGPPQYFASLRRLAQGVKGQYAHRLAQTIRETVHLE